MVTDSQVRRLFAMKNKVKYLYQLADKAGMSSKTARKYLKSGVLPSQCRAIHDWPIQPRAGQCKFTVHIGPLSGSEGMVRYNTCSSLAKRRKSYVDLGRKNP